MGTSLVGAEEAATAAHSLRPPIVDTVRVVNRQPEGRSAATDVEKFRHRVDDLVSKADELEQTVSGVVQFYAIKKQPSNPSPGSGGAKKQTDGCRKEFACTKRMQELMRQFGTILKQISQHKWAWPFLEPVDIKGLGLHDYHEETRQEEEEARDLANMQIARESAMAKMARDTNNELNDLYMHLEELREMVIQKCRKISAYEKRKLGVELSYLSPEDLEKAIEIVAEDNPSFQATTPAAEIDLDAQSQTTIWKLKFFVKEALEVQAKTTASKGDENLKRKKEICDALAKTAKKRNRKQA